MPVISSTTTTTTTSGSAVNGGYFKSVNGLLKIIQLLAGCITLGISGYHIGNAVEEHLQFRNSYNSELFFFTIVVTFFLSTFMLVLSNILSFRSTNISSTTYVRFFIINELLYN